MRVLLCGDWHGDLGWAEACLQQAVSAGCEHVVQLGDFGFVFRQDETWQLQQMLDDNEFELTISFLPGNHENWTQLDAATGDTGPLGGILLQPQVEYLGRQQRFELGGATFAALGGAYSIDARFRTPYVTWWPEELTTDESVDELGTEPVDVLLTHDACVNETLEWALRGNPFAPHLTEKQQGESYANRERVHRAFETLQPRLQVHGHMHHFYVHEFPSGQQVVGLACNGMPHATCVFDAATFKVEW